MILPTASFTALAIILPALTHALPFPAITVMSSGSNTVNTTPATTSFSLVVDQSSLINWLEIIISSIGVIATVTVPIGILMYKTRCRRARQTSDAHEQSAPTPTSASVVLETCPVETTTQCIAVSPNAEPSMPAIDTGANTDASKSGVEPSPSTVYAVTNTSEPLLDGKKQSPYPNVNPKAFDSVSSFDLDEDKSRPSVDSDMVTDTMFQLSRENTSTQTLVAAAATACDHRRD